MQVNTEPLAITGRVLEHPMVMYASPHPVVSETKVYLRVHSEWPILASKSRWLECQGTEICQGPDDQVLGGSKLWLRDVAPRRASIRYDVGWESREAGYDVLSVFVHGTHDVWSSGICKGGLPVLWWCFHSLFPADDKSFGLPKIRDGNLQNPDTVSAPLRPTVS